MMGPELFKRWMDMLFWWLPRDSNRSEGQQSPGAQREHQGTSSAGGSAASRETQTPGTGEQAAAAGNTAGAATGQPEAASQPQASSSVTDSEAVDDLTTIKGVGPAMAARLQEMGIRTFEDLAAADIKAVTRQLREQSVVISEKKVEGWVQAARKQG